MLYPRTIALHRLRRLAMVLRHAAARGLAGAAHAGLYLAAALSLLPAAASAQTAYGGGPIPAGWNLFFADIDQDSYGDASLGFLFPNAAPP